MRILHVNKFLYRRAGAEGYMLDVASRQEDAGHEVAFFAMNHPDNLPSRFERHFPPYIEFDPLPAALGDKVRAVGRIMYSPSSRRGIDRVLTEFRPDLVHLHNIYHHLSPSILAPLARHAIPAVMTLHDYKLACPTYRFLDHGQICEACLGGKFHQALLRRCKDGSLVSSGVAGLELTLHTATRAYDPVDLFLCPSRFIAGKMAEAGVFPDRLRWIPNFVDIGRIEPKRGPGGGVVCAGRLSEEKGVDVLIEAAAGLDVPVDIAGEGPERPRLERLAERLGAHSVRFHGRLPTEALFDLVRASAVSVIPSRWYENQPLAVLESFACGVPVIGTTLGGIPEIIAPGVDGQIVPPNDPAALALAIRSFVDRPDDALQMGRAGREKMERDFAPPSHLQRLDALYGEAISAAARKRRGARRAIRRLSNASAGTKR